MAKNRRTEYEIALLMGGQVQASFGNSINTVNSGFDKMVSMAKSTAKMVAATFGAVKIGQFVSDAIDTYSEYEQSMANTAAVAQATEREYEQLEAAAREMGKATTKTAAEASDALGYMMLAGWDAGEAISGLEPVLRLSEATQMDLATCSDLVTDSMSALGLSVEELGSYLDICTAANNNANTTAKALMEAFIGCGGAAKTTGADINDVATALGVLANNGTKGAEAGTAVNAMLVRMTSKDAAISAMNELGVSAFDASGEFIGLQNVLVDMQGALSKLSTEEQAHYMSKIAGTNYYTEMRYLLDAVAESADGAESAWDDLSGKLEDSDGALLNMADTVTDTLKGAYARLDSAVDDAKISFADVFADDLKDSVNTMAAYIPTLTDKFIDFAAKAGPKISKTFQTITKGAGQMLDVVSGAGEWMVENFDTVERMVAGIGGAIIGYKVISGLSGVASGIKGIGAAINAMSVSNPILLAATVSIAAIAGIASAIKTAEKQAVKSNLAAHFGNIALSMDDISEAADHIVQTESLTKVQESLEAFAELDGIQDSIQGSLDAINKMNWKLSIGMELSADDNDAYISEMQNYIEQVQEYITQEQYAININLSGFADGSAEREKIISNLNNFYSDIQYEAAAIAAELSDVMNEAFSDGLLEIDEAEKIAELQAQMARVQEKLTTSDYDAKLKMMELEYSGSGLDAESAKELQAEVDSLTNEAVAQYKEVLQKNISSYETMLSEGYITESEYNEAINEFWEEYLTNASELQTKAMNFGVNTLMDAYGENLEPAIADVMQGINEMLGEDYIEEHAADWAAAPVVMWEAMKNALEDSIQDDTTRKAIAEFMESMAPTLEGMEELSKQWENCGGEMPEAFLTGLTNAETLEAVVNGGENIYFVLGQKMKGNEHYEELVDTLNEQGLYVPEAVIEGMKTGTEAAIPSAVDEMYEYTNECIQKTFAQHFDVSAMLDITWQTNMESGLAAINGVPIPKPERLRGHADGGIFNTPHIAWFAEDGPEAAIPLDGSSNAISLWEKVGQLLGMFDDSPSVSRGTEIYNGLTGYPATTNNTVSESTDARQLIFSPNITIEGNASREDVDESLRFSMEEFRDFMEQYLSERERVSFA